MLLQSKRARWGTPKLLPACRQNEAVARSREKEFPEFTFAKSARVAHARSAQNWADLQILLKFL